MSGYIVGRPISSGRARAVSWASRCLLRVHRTERIVPQDRHREWLRPLPVVDLRVAMNNNVQQQGVNFQVSVVTDKAQFAEIVHEKAHTRPRHSDHFRESFLT
jgi:hypothetical protein